MKCPCKECIIKSICITKFLELKYLLKNDSDALLYISDRCNLLLDYIWDHIYNNCTFKSPPTFLEIQIEIHKGNIILPEVFNE